MRFAAADFARVRSGLPGLQGILNQYIQALLMQQSQVVLCNGRHTIHERVCRWLLLLRDRLGSDEVPVTHELLSLALGVRRAGVTNALASLEATGAVGRGRGRVMIRDTQALEACACECYRIITEEYDRMLSQGSTPAG